ncbi:hypothetical protein N7510_011118 [Penicillium lagena]|uniref:uncharacterized protein n=1 Tax=Penicillium lagena TaxID=94218 RepID=UPI0025404722|nr:uncharacterized protein N7510_011118 [Penicillium lagena]KAJ5601584.1 hypothetical protein N7510_011118 [Penicillium lagena]
MALRTSAENAEDVAAGFQAFRVPLPEHKTEITRLISDLYGLSASFTTIDALIKDPRYKRGFARAHADIELVRGSLKYTCQDVFDFFGQLDSGNVPTEQYRRTWVAMNRFFWDESQYSLTTRLAKYKSFLGEITDVVQNKEPNLSLLSRSRNSLKTLLATQDQRLAPRLERMNLGRNPSSSDTNTEPRSPASDRRPRARRSYERPRPPGSLPQSPASGTFDVPPQAPDAPSSPLTGSTTATTTTTSQSANDAIKYHWAKEVFSSPDTDTPIPAPESRSECYGKSDPGIKQWLREAGFQEVLQLAFADGNDMRVAFHLRPNDHRARMLCKTPHRSRPSEYSCIPLNMLEIARDGSCLQLCRRRRQGTELVMWANLSFTNIEILFYVTFLALRSQDAGRPVEYIRDYELNEEGEIYGGQIIDDGFPHALRVYQDTVTGAVRLQASVHRGELKRTPVWTAFITSYLGTSGWLRRTGPEKVLIRDLRPAILMSADDYNAPQTPRGGFILTFLTSDDADGFLDTIAELAALTIVR